MSTHDNSDLTKKELRQQLDQLGNVIERLAGQSGEPRPIKDRSLSGNKVDGGKITNFSSSGIKDEATNFQLFIRNNGIHVDRIHSKEATLNKILNDLSVEGNVSIVGDVKARRLHVDEITADKLPEPRSIKDRELSGNKINGGQIINFSSTGIKDEAKNTVLTVREDGIHANQATIKRLNSEVSVGGDLDVEGEVRARRLHVDEVTSDSRLERSTSLEFRSDDKKSVVGKGLQWLTDENTKQLVLRNNPYRLWSSESIDVHRGQSYYVNGEQVLSEGTLGPTVTQSSLQKVGTLRGLTVMGNLNVDQFLFWDSTAMRLGIGTDAPNAMLSLVSLESEFIIDPEEENVRIGTWTNDGIDIITDNTTRLSVSYNGDITLGIKGNTDTKVSVHGKFGVGVSNPDPDVSITSSGPIRFENKKFEVGSDAPRNGLYKIGDIVWNNKPKPTGYVGWVCVREGTPGMWKPFGQIGS